MERFTGLLGLVLLLGLAWLFSANRKAIRWRIVTIGIGPQIGFAAAVMERAMGTSGAESLNVAACIVGVLL